MWVALAGGNQAGAPFPGTPGDPYQVSPRTPHPFNPSGPTRRSKPRSKSKAGSRSRSRSRPVVGPGGPAALLVTPAQQRAESRAHDEPMATRIGPAARAGDTRGTLPHSHQGFPSRVSPAPPSLPPSGPTQGPATRARVTVARAGRWRERNIRRLRPKPRCPRSHHGPGNSLLPFTRCPPYAERAPHTAVPSQFTCSARLTAG
jgi:hypothetical protein